MKSRKEKLKRIIIFMIGCGVIVGLYMYLASLNNYVLTYALMISYIVIFLGLIFGYVIYNRGMLGKRVSSGDLDPAIPKDEREHMAFVINERKDKSFWMLPIAAAFLLSFLLDYMGVQEIFGKIWNIF